MSNKFYISDLHIGHKNVLTFDKRPFSNLNEMHEVIISNWNCVVNNDDEVYILGDFAWKNDIGLEILKQLKGKKFLILGNHDRINSEMQRYFVWIKPYAEIKDNDTLVILCHYPIAHWKNADYGSIHLYGHIHSGRDCRPFEQYKQIIEATERTYKCYNMGCMLHNYTPKTLAQIINGG